VGCFVMKYRVAIWAVTGFLVAGGWAIYASGHVMTDSDRLMPLITLTCPIVFLRSYSLSLYLVLAVNAATYGLIGLAVETVRRQFKHAS
jgi:hypothetical protein